MQACWTLQVQALDQLGVPDGDEWPEQSPQESGQQLQLLRAAAEEASFRELFLGAPLSTFWGTETLDAACSLSDARGGECDADAQNPRTQKASCGPHSHK